MASFAMERDLVDRGHGLDPLLHPSSAAGDRWRFAVDEAGYQNSGGCGTGRAVTQRRPSEGLNIDGSIYRYFKTLLTIPKFLEYP